jgi:hypothetical protein
MKKLMIALALLVFASVFSACGPTPEEGIAYNDAIIDEQEILMDKINAVYESFVNYEDMAGMDNALTAAQQQAVTALDNVKKMEAFDKKTDFRDAAITLFEIYKSVTLNELPQVIALYKLPEDQYTQEKKDEADKLIDQSIAKMDEGMAKFDTEK